MSLLFYTGHPLVDVGVATIVAFANKYSPEELTDEDVDNVMNYILIHYTTLAIKNYISAAFTQNSAYLQPSYSGKPALRAARVIEVLHGSDTKCLVTGRNCVFCGREASMMALMHHIPMIGAGNVFNFYSEGVPGLPVCKSCMLAIQVFPLGSIRSKGRVLLVYSDCEKILLYFARKFLEENMLFLQMASLDDFPAEKFPKTALINALEDAEKLHHRNLLERACTITAYHLFNDLRKAAADIYQLPTAIVRFIAEANTPTYQATWNALVARGWEVPKAKAKPEDQEKGEGQRRNFLYEDLFTLPEEARRFLSTYFLRRPLKHTYDVDPRRQYSLAQDLGLISWDLTTLFLREAMNMDRTRIEAIEQLADRLADHAIHQDRRLFLQIHHARSYSDLRRRLVIADIESVKAGKLPLLTFDSFLEVFEEGEDIARPDWSLARDLVLIRMIERMYKEGVFSMHPELAREAAEDTQTEESPARA